MYKSTQTVEIKIEGPNEQGRFRAEVYSAGFYPQEAFPDPIMEAIDKHVAETCITINGFEIRPRDDTPGCFTAHQEDGLDVSAYSLEGAQWILSAYAADRALRQFVPAAAALVAFFSDREDK